ncbi:hypothetical protein WA026_012390 [Henosepilachna vigintioctopunctata]|uniref:Uncharacterized protein n=1 Tax=Henosepilachna vigintioctopunctata TaxID=420089 RepID=A0AAW1UT01_9CUCU
MQNPNLSHIRCLKCGNDHEINDCKAENYTCFQCKRNHAAKDLKNCRIFSMQKKIKEKMATEEKFYRKAKNSIESRFANAASVNTFVSNDILSLSVNSHLQFPSMRQKEK